ncbi:uncharacterized protein LOC142497849 isoform X2 [Ascaphus truei]|uniref:uncharacterized protein LOC142497849 isoform X2 n=1 Tax=Ascaphus truei TaxID=8439 RepID=UPI003F5A6825
MLCLPAEGAGPCCGAFPAHRQALLLLSVTRPFSAAHGGTGAAPPDAVLHHLKTAEDYTSRIPETIILLTKNFFSVSTHTLLYMNKGKSGDRGEEKIPSLQLDYTCYNQRDCRTSQRLDPDRYEPGMGLLSFVWLLLISAVLCQGQSTTPAPLKPGPSCPPGAEWSSCSGCGSYCPVKDMMCATVCSDGCACTQKGYVIYNGTCIPSSECPYIPPNEK